MSEAGGDEEGGEFREEVEEESYMDRMKSSIKGVGIGLLLFFGSWGVLFWNEGRAVRRQEDLDEGRNIVQQLGLTQPNAVIDKGFDNKLVYVTGRVEGNDVLYDGEFNLNVTKESKGAIKYRRKVEVYQWKETKKTKTEKTSSGKEKKVYTYSYRKTWSTRLIRSSNFKERKTPSNPTSFLVSPKTLVADDVGLGPFNLSSDVISQIDWETSWLFPPVDPDKLSFSGYDTNMKGSTLEITDKNSIGDKVGDHRVEFYIVKSDDVSVVAKQGSTGQLEPYITSANRELLLFSRGTLSSDALFDQAEDDNTSTTWAVRFGGFFAMVGGICLVLNPIATMLDVLPFCGDALEGMVGNCVIPIIAVCISFPLTLLIISIAWMFYRPWTAIFVILLLGGFAFFYIKYLKPYLLAKQGKQPSESTSAKGASGESDGDDLEQQNKTNKGGPVPFSQALDNFYTKYVKPKLPNNGEQASGSTAKAASEELDGDDVEQQKNKTEEPGAPFSEALDNPPPAAENSTTPEGTEPTAVISSAESPSSPDESPTTTRELDEATPAPIQSEATPEEEKPIKKKKKKKKKRKKKKSKQNDESESATEHNEAEESSQALESSQFLESSQALDNPPPEENNSPPGTGADP